HKKMRCLNSAITESVGNNQLCVRVDGRPCPAVASAIFHLFFGYILLLGVNESPDFIALNATHFQVADGAIVELSTGAAHVFQQLQNGVLCNSGQASNGVDRDAFNESGDYLSTLRDGQAVHDAQNRNACKQACQEKSTCMQDFSCNLLAGYSTV